MTLVPDGGKSLYSEPGHFPGEQTAGDRVAVVRQGKSAKAKRDAKIFPDGC